MRRINSWWMMALAIMAVVLLGMNPGVLAQATEHGSHFVDQNGDGYNDNAPDADGDGIPNGQDPDYVAGSQNGQREDKGFKDENGDGINDLAPDADGDGIPNGQDPDYVRPQDGTGYQEQNGNGNGHGVRGFVDENGDGLNDNAPDADGDGIPNGQDADYQKPGTGAAFGKGFGRGVHGFVDEDGDGFNDNAPDADGDGIPNGQDADWQRPEDCLGRGSKVKPGFGNPNPGAGAGSGDGAGSGAGNNAGKGKHGGRG